MPSIIDFRAVLIANIIGITVLFSVLRGHYWRVKNPSRDNRIMMALFLVCLISCIMDPLCFWADGRPGIANTILIWMGNTWLYLANLAFSLCFHALVSTHLGLRLCRIHKIFLAVPTVILCALTFVNLFVPIVFTVKDNVYCRTDMYYLYLAVEAAISLDALLIYMYVRHSSGRLKFFPAASFVVPAAIGIFIQSVSYGVSTIFPFYAVSFGCVATALQNEFVFRDQLTGLYNRFFLYSMEKKLSKTSAQEYTVMMLDINGFKSINDTYGHNMGDQALMETSKLLLGIIRENGLVIRYAGDEFIIILFNSNAEYAKKVIDTIHAEFKKFNASSENPYELSMSIGHCRASTREQSMNELVDKVDKLMYEDKRTYYEQNTECDRRK